MSVCSTSSVCWKQHVSLKHNRVQGRRISLAHKSSSKQSRICCTASEPTAVSSKPSRFPGVRPDLVPSKHIVLSMEVDVDALIAKAAFPIPPEDLVQLTKAFIKAQTDQDADKWFSEDFLFVAPVVGPFNKKTFTEALSSFELLASFPDFTSNFHDFRVDPFQPNRVFFTTKFTGTNTGKVLGLFDATGKAVESAPEAQSVTFNERGEVTKYTIGYVLDKQVGNTGGLGGVFGIFHAIGYGLPFPEGQPWQPSPVYGFFLEINKRADSPLIKQVRDFVKSFGLGSK
eukprot:CAMPEP_0198202042 /NCGR_PEP_ID=MMETSP1445-20131203/5100_1 /TAXON_ID=36898 /ORGANISM="Pyramimonas sp., Strain CCMP2087" /LENGTH=285 /DNA_ID=CAMNT_0043872755 /DNA_START=128 /DNA_END=985 /DNA_ORIENTATION=-